MMGVSKVVGIFSFYRKVREDRGEVPLFFSAHSLAPTAHPA
jgi:hypothetical protein